MTTFIHDDAPCRRHNDSVILSTCFAFFSASIFHPNMKPNCLDAAFARSAISFFTPEAGGNMKCEIICQVSSLHFVSHFSRAELSIILHTRPVEPARLIRGTRGEIHGALSTLK